MARTSVSSLAFFSCWKSWSDGAARAGSGAALAGAGAGANDSSDRATMAARNCLISVTPGRSALSQARVVIAQLGDGVLDRFEVRVEVERPLVGDQRLTVLADGVHDRA